jgi:hypothetical protein
MNYQKIIEWFAGNDTGQSSKHMAAVAAGVRGNGNHPLDPSDLGRCIRLVQNVPDIIGAFPAIEASGSKWMTVINHWAELTELYAEESQGRAHFNAPKTYKRMKELGL